MRMNFFYKFNKHAICIKKENKITKTVEAQEQERDSHIPLQINQIYFIAFISLNIYKGNLKDKDIEMHNQKVKSYKYI